MLEKETEYFDTIFVLKQMWESSLHDINIKKKKSLSRLTYCWVYFHFDGDKKFQVDVNKMEVFLGET